MRTQILNYRYSCWPVLTSCSYNMVLPLRGYSPILPLAYHCSAQSCPTCLHPTLRQSGSCPSDHCLPTKTTNQATWTNSFYHSPTLKWENFSKSPSLAFSTLLCSKAHCQVLQSGRGIWPDIYFPLGQQLNHRGQTGHSDSDTSNKAMTFYYQSAADVWYLWHTRSSNVWLQAQYRSCFRWQKCTPEPGSVLAEPLLHTESLNQTDSWMDYCHCAHKNHIYSALQWKQITWRSCQ